MRLPFVRIVRAIRSQFGRTPLAPRLAPGPSADGSARVASASRATRAPRSGRAPDLAGLKRLLLLGVILPWVGAHAQPAATEPPVDLPPAALDAIRLTQAGISEEVIVAELKQAGAAHPLRADQIIALANSGVSQHVIRALIDPAGSPAPAPGPVEAAPPASGEPDLPPVTAPGPLTLDAFRAPLAPYGTWVQVPGYGWVWTPAAAADPLWRPYVDQGHWIYTEAGMYWQSEYPWGDRVFHYGRWLRLENLGWVWVPDTTWGPAWVCWRYSSGDQPCCGWAPLPPEARAVFGVGLVFHGRVALDIDFDLSSDAFVFVGADHLLDVDCRAHLLAADAARAIYGRTTVGNGYRVSNGRLMVDGPGAERLATWSRRPIHPVPFREPRPAPDRGRGRQPEPPARGKAEPAPDRKNSPPS